MTERHPARDNPFVGLPIGPLGDHVPGTSETERNDLLVTNNDGVWLAREVPVEQPESLSAALNDLAELGDRQVYLCKWTDGQQTVAAVYVKVELRNADSDVDTLRAVMDKHGLPELEADANPDGIGSLLPHPDSMRTDSAFDVAGVPSSGCDGSRCHVARKHELGDH